MNKNTFGGTKAAEVLVKILTKPINQHLQKRISSTLEHYSRGLREIKGLLIKDHLALLWRDDYLRKTSHYEGELKTFTHNVIKTKYTEFINN